ncbi:glycosyl transferase [Primorskyibacter flagellatus]|uniref:Glycosyl transferase n=1 Tax=Primorskyibacter flagellatus TaxID=1387277 RepID=A0A917EGK6_9RHOB|nr:glycosyltransferase [Primorskyibacter flagellatus]GGE38285.1 glycosyl transferase [Primorskyibacter flagellatus]
MEITVLMPLLDGARFLVPQLESLAAQTRPPNRLIVSDDGSTDAGPEIVRDFARRAPFRVTVLQGPGQGYAANVLSLLTHAPCGALAFCDQDDVWVTDRIARGVKALDGIEGPVLHVTERLVTRADLSRPRNLPRRKEARKGLHNESRGLLAEAGTVLRGSDRRIAENLGQMAFDAALVQNLAPANATLINPAAATLAKVCLGRLPAPPFPDWWLFALVLGAGGRVIYDDKPGVLYRQHGGNLLGAARGAGGVIRRLRHLVDGTYGRWLRNHADALASAGDHLTPAALIRLNRFRMSLEGMGTMSRDCSRNGVAEQVLFRIALRLNRI